MRFSGVAGTHAMPGLRATPGSGQRSAWEGIVRDRTTGKLEQRLRIYNREPCNNHIGSSNHPLATLMPHPFAAFYRGKRTLVTGHTGFQGGWLVAWLKLLGAKVCGYGPPP